MPRAQWSLCHGRPAVEVILTLTQTGKLLPRRLLADTGAGSRNTGLDPLLEETDCLLCGGYFYQFVRLSGAYAGVFPAYFLPVRLPALAFKQDIPVVAVSSAPAGFDGIACFRFLNRFTYGNFGDPSQFGLEC